MKVPFRFKPLDSILGGGLESGTITMVYGEAGTGKTNLCLVMARSVVSAGSRVAYVDSEGVSPDRVAQVFAESPDEVRQILFYRPTTLWEQEHSISQAVKLEDIALIIVDTFNMMLRPRSGEDRAEVSRSSDRQLDVLYRTARVRDIPVLMAGQVFGGPVFRTGSGAGTGTGNGDQITRKGPGIYYGSSAEHIAKTLILLEKTGEPNHRSAVLMKHRSLPEGLSAEFRLCDTGICEI